MWLQAFEGLSDRDACDRLEGTCAGRPPLESMPGIGRRAIPATSYQYLRKS
jgi:hypothetical protein